MNIQSFFDGLRKSQATSAETIGDMKADHAMSARLIATAEYELEALLRELRRANGGLAARPVKTP